jgi:Fe-S-cluster containining protein
VLKRLRKTRNPADLLAVLRSEQKQFERAYMTAPAAARASVACRAGCDACCHVPVGVQAHEVLIVAEHIQKTFSPEELEGVIARTVAHRAAFAGKTNRAQAALKSPCVLLRAGNCTVYEARPEACRSHHSHNAAACGQNLDFSREEIDVYVPGVRGRMFAVMLGIDQAVAEAGYDGQAYDFGSALASAAIQNELSSWAVLALIQLHAFCSAPTWSIASTIVFARLADGKKEFGPIRAMATLGWMAGCLAVSAVGADDSTLAGYGGALIWLVVSGITFWLPALAAPKSVANLTWSQRMGYDALSLLKNRDHRVVFLTVALFTIPVAAFYPYSPLNLRELGFSHTVAWMSLGQVTEVIAMLALGALMLRFRLKWIIVGGLALGVVRFGLAATDSPWGILAAIVLHGASFTLVSITAQIYIDERVDPAWRARAQALMSLLNGGIGNMIGYLGSGAWFVACSAGGTMRWPMFWSGLSATMAAVLIFFLLMYRGRGARDGKVV